MGYRRKHVEVWFRNRHVSKLLARQVAAAKAEFEAESGSWTHLLFGLSVRICIGGRGEGDSRACVHHEQ